LANAKKLPSGQWRTLVYDYTDTNGKRHYESFTAETKKESEYMAAEFAVNKKNKKAKGTLLMFKDAAMNYCDERSNILSPSTIMGYKQLMRNAYGSINDIKIKDFDRQTLQSWVNEYSATHAPKTVRNAYGFLTSVIRFYDDSFSIRISLPEKLRKDVYVPNDSDIRTLMEYYKETDHDMLIASCLSAFGTMRRSEICGLDAEHIDGCIIKVRQAMVPNENYKFVLKKFAKNYSSARDIAMPQFVIDMLPKKGMIINFTPGVITHRHITALNNLDIPYFRFHDLRHYSASIMHALGIPDQYIMERGGWSSDKVLKEIYRGTIDDYNKRFEEVMMQHYENIQHEMQHKN